jgi:protein PhnA
MSILNQLQERCQGTCELCNNETAAHTFYLNSKEDDINLQVAICNTCKSSVEDEKAEFHWRCLEGSIWSPIESVQALCYRILKKYSEQNWAADILNSVDLEDRVKELAMQGTEKKEIHKDAFGNILQNGDNVVLTQALDVKGTSFTASKGTVVKKIKLVQDNPEQIEGKINEQLIVILAKFVKKN